MKNRQTKNSNTSDRRLFDEVKPFERSRCPVGVTLIAVGLVGLLVPILPGWALIFVGLLLLFPKSGKKVVKKIRSYFMTDSSKRYS